MKTKQILLVAFTSLGMALSTYAQQLKVGSNPTTIDASSVFEAESTTKGFLPPRMTTAQRDAIANPAKGLFLYNTTLDCLQINKGTAAVPTWECIGASAAPTVAVDCSTAGFNTGTYVSGTSVGTATYTVTITNNSFSSVSLTNNNSDLSITGVPNITVLSVAPATLNLNAGQSGTITYNLTGTPTSCGTLTGTWTKLSLTCTKTVIVAIANFVNAGTNVVRNTSGNVTEFTANWAAQPGTTSYQVEIATTSSGPWTAVSGSPFSGTSTTITGLSGLNSYWVKVTLQNGACVGSSSSAFAASSGCLVKNSPTTQKLWLCHDLGADITADPHIASVALHGAFVQWGRRGPTGPTGNSAIDWQTAATTSNFMEKQTPTNKNDGSIPGWSTTAAPNGSWSSVKTVNDPCPTGFRVPTVQEWTDMFNNNTFRTNVGTFSPSQSNFDSYTSLGNVSGQKSLTFAMSGNRTSTSFTQAGRGNSYQGWAADNPGSNRAFITDSSSAVIGSDTRDGHMVRCIQE